MREHSQLEEKNRETVAAAIDKRGIQQENRGSND